jgi:putative two-component system response regulator
MHQKTTNDARILIVDDQDANVALLKRILSQAGMTNLVPVYDSREAISVFLGFRPDLVLLDLHMPHLSGFEVMEQLGRHIPEGSFLPVVMLTADVTVEAKRRALSMGAKDFLAKPFDALEVVLRVTNLLESRFLYLELRDQNALLEQRVEERTRDLERAQVETLERLALAAEFRDDATHRHTQRVGQLSASIAESLGLPSELVKRIGRAAPLHDIGKIGIPDHILLKRGKLGREEFEIIKSHTAVGARILSGSQSPLLQVGEEIARAHHERWDGTGYGEALSGESIPLAGRIVAVADVFDALTHERPYKDAWPVDDAIAEIKRQSGRQFDPRVVDAFLVATAGGTVLEPREGSAA